MKNRVITIAMAMVALFGLSLTVTAAQSRIINLVGNEVAEINCEGSLLVMNQETDTKVTAECRPNEEDPPSGAIPLPIKINFQPASAPVPDGYLVDDGSVFDANRTYGWSQNHTNVARDRNAHSDQRLDTLMHFHKNSTWEISLPNGDYKVEYSVGDPSFSSTYFLDIEGNNVVNNTKLNVGDFVQNNLVVTVNDGLLTLNGGRLEKGTRINYIIIDTPDSEPEPEPEPTNLAVVDLILVNADTDQDIGPLTDGATINFNELGTQNLSVRAETQPSIVGSVRFSLDDNASLQTENISPYTIAGDNNGDYNSWTPSIGQHTLTVTPYTETSGGGTAGAALKVTFTVINGGSEPEPTDTPEPDPTDPPPSSSVPLCEDHDPTQWHALYDAEKNCHYNHEHKDDPHLVDDIFGPVGALYGGQEISYPWQTFSNAGMENDLKHEGYGWLVGKDIDCNIAQGEYCITDFRTQFHAIMAANGATTRFHSFAVEARLCRNGQCGILRTGGWADYNVLTVDGVHVPLANDGNLPPIVRKRDHRTGEYTRYNAAWYGAQQQGTWAFIGLDGETWGLVTADDPMNLHLFCPDFQCEANGSVMEMHILAFEIHNYWDKLDGAEDGFVTLDIYTDRHGNFAQGCTEPALDCVPLQLTNVPVGSYQYRDDRHGVVSKEYDTSPPGEYWITFPN